MGVWPLILVALFAGFMGLLQTDWSQLFGDPAREAFRELLSRVQGWEDVEATLTVWGIGQVPVRMRVQAMIREGAVRLELLAPAALEGHIFTYRQGMLVHYLPENGGVRVVHILDKEAFAPRIDLSFLRVSLEEWEPGFPQKRGPPLTLPGIAGSKPRPHGLVGDRGVSSFPLTQLKKLRISGLPEPLEEVTVWLDDEGRIRGGSVVFRGIRVTVLVEDLRPNQGLTLLELLRLPRAARTLWQKGGQSM